MGIAFHREVGSVTAVTVEACATDSKNPDNDNGSHMHFNICFMLLLNIIGTVISLATKNHFMSDPVLNTLSNSTEVAKNLREY